MAQVKTKRQNEQKFEPIDFTITIESKEELHFLWHLFNQSGTEKMEQFLSHKGSRPFISNQFKRPDSLGRKPWKHLDKFVK